MYSVEIKINELKRELVGYRKLKKNKDNDLLTALEVEQAQYKIERIREELIFLMGKGSFYDWERRDISQ